MSSEEQKLREFIARRPAWREIQKGVFHAGGKKKSQMEVERKSRGKGKSRWILIVENGNNVSWDIDI